MLLATAQDGIRIASGLQHTTAGRAMLQQMALRYTRRTALLFPALALGKTPDFEQIDLFRQGDAGVHTYRIPALLETRSGTLLAVTDARHENDHDLPGRISILIRRSRNQGRTWTAPTTLREVPAGGVGDASLLLDPRTGRIWCFHAYGPPGIGFLTAQAGATTGTQTLQFHATHSDDDGLTWSAPVDLTPQVKAREWRALFATSGTHFVTSKGRYLVPLVVRDGDGQLAARNAFSDDSGRSWQVSSAIAPASDESKVVELANGTLLQNMRNGKRRLTARSLDGVHFETASHDEALIDPGCNAGMVRYRHGSHDLLIFSNAASEKRENLAVRYSRDGGRTWSAPRVLHAGPAAYSTVIGLRDGTLGVLYERGEQNPAERITFARFSMKWLLQSSAEQR